MLHFPIFLACLYESIGGSCTTFHRYPIFNMRYSVMCKVYTGYCGTSEIEHGLCACTVDNPLAKARVLSLRTGTQPMLYLPLIVTLVLALVLIVSMSIGVTLLLYDDFFFFFLCDGQGTRDFPRAN